MSDKTGIEWTDATWNPTVGCTKVSPGCDHCYAETLVNRFAGHKAFPNRFDQMHIRDERTLTLPLRWLKPRRIFVNSLSDLFHRDIPDEFIARVFAVMALAPQHTFQLLTKRHGRMQALLNSYDFRVGIDGAREQIKPGCGDWVYPLPNLWLGVSAEDQHRYNLRWPALRETPTAVRFISAEPLLDQLSLFGSSRVDGYPMPDWVIVGGESGRSARPMHPLWPRTLRDECTEHGIPFLFKQRGEWTWSEPGHFVMPAQPYTDRIAVMHGAGMVAMTKSNPFNPFEHGHPFWATRIERVGKHAAGRELDGRTWDEYPAAAS